MVANCPRCRASRITFDLFAQTGAADHPPNWQQWYEVFCICRHCSGTTIFVVAEEGIDEANFVRKTGLPQILGH
ncbi:MAG TPA: hypothetical protein VFT36_06810, partial [Methylomirabilota bacterium]|nr:hypothetical protein [Methylomirabilota bacterium]